MLLGKIDLFTSKVAIFLKSKFKLKTYYLNPQPSNIVNHNIDKKEKLKIKYFYIKGCTEILNSLYKMIKKTKIKIFLQFLYKKDNFRKKNKKKIYSNKKSFMLTMFIFLIIVSLIFIKKKHIKEENQYIYY